MAVFQATPSPSATRAAVRVLAHDAFERPPQTTPRELRHAAQQPGWCPGATHARSRSTDGDRIVTTSVVGRQPSGSCARRRVTVSRGVHSHPQRRHHLSSDPSGSTTRRAKTARSSSNRCPVTSDPARRVGRTRSDPGQRSRPGGSVRHVEVFRMGSVRTSIFGRPRPPIPATDAPTTATDDITRPLHPQLKSRVSAFPTEGDTGGPRNSPSLTQHA